jgi:glycosyltransferase involved in cell wall biosynthesis
MKTSEPVSIIIPTYNRASLVGRAVESALASCRPGDEIIVVDDGSTDSTEQVLMPYLGVIKYLKTVNGGGGAARNRGIEIAQHNLIAFLDSDDEWMSGGLELRRRLLEAQPDLVFCCSNFAVRTAAGEEIHNYLVHWHKDERSWHDILGPGTPLSDLVEVPPEHGDILVHRGSLYRQLLHANYVYTCTWLVRRSLVGDALRFGEDLVHGEDWIAFANVASKGPGAYLDCETGWQYGHEGERISDADTLKRTKYRLMLMERVWGSDPDFLLEHGDEYKRVQRDVRLTRVRTLIARGDLQEARELLQHIAGAPLTFRVLANMPASLSHAIVRARSSMSRRIGQMRNISPERSTA